MALKAGDRVRVVQADSPYTGCRGTVASSPETESSELSPFGYYVAIDGENGVARPFLVSALEPLAPARVHSASQVRAPGREKAG